MPLKWQPQINAKMYIKPYSNVYHRHRQTYLPEKKYLICSFQPNSFILLFDDFDNQDGGIRGIAFFILFY